MSDAGKKLTGLAMLGMTMNSTMADTNTTPAVDAVLSEERLQQYEMHYYRPTVHELVASHRELQRQLTAATAGADTTAVYMVWTSEHGEAVCFLTQEAAEQYIDNDLFVIEDVRAVRYERPLPWQVRSVLDDDELETFATREEAESWLATNTPRCLAQINWHELKAPGVNDLKRQITAARKLIAELLPANEWMLEQWGEGNNFDPTSQYADEAWITQEALIAAARAALDTPATDAGEAGGVTTTTNSRYPSIAEAQAALERAEKASGGPWKVDADEGDWEQSPYCHVEGWTDLGEDWMCLDMNDAAFIAAAREDVPSLARGYIVALLVLAWYADRENYVEQPTGGFYGDVFPSSVEDDEGERARAFLRQVGGVESLTVDDVQGVSEHDLEEFKLGLAAFFRAFTPQR